ncbi:MAG: 5-formyltetrahydrofolate cyclo-ligase [Actinomycetia bacterium]|nr:5-formyltetrahydrofolate cyclo-ligase [Actinomycetes bacterium]
MVHDPKQKRFPKLPHFHQTHAHRSLFWLLPCFLPLLAALILGALLGMYRQDNPYLGKSVFGLVGIDLGFLAVALVCALAISLLPYWLRRLGAPLVVMLMIVAWYAFLLAYPPFWLMPAETLPAVAMLAACIFVPVLLCLPFVRTLKQEKAEFRKAAIRRRVSVAPEQRLRESRQACERMFAMISALDKNNGYVAVYEAAASELSLEFLIVKLATAGFKPAYPAILDNETMAFYSTLDCKDIDLETLELFADPFTLKTEKMLSALNRVLPQDLICVIVPGVAFDRQCFRMGFGGGFYDRYLPKLLPGSKTYGICYDEQVYRSLPVEVHDKRLDAVVSASRIYK